MPNILTTQLSITKTLYINSTGASYEAAIYDKELKIFTSIKPNMNEDKMYVYLGKLLQKNE